MATVIIVKDTGELCECDDTDGYMCWLWSRVLNANFFDLASVTIFQRSDCSPGDCITQQHSLV